MKRITSIDAVRGLVMVVMALDHVRDLIHVNALEFDPTNLTTTTPSLFFTRWITHLCAPTFVFLSGVSAYLAYTNSSDPASSKKFLLKRGLWLVLLEITIINFGIWFNIHFSIIMLQVIAAIGVGFILLSFFLRLKPLHNFIIAVVITLLCNLVVGLNLSQLPILGFFYNWLFSPNLLQITPNFMLLINYPVLPWFGIMLAGFACGVLFTQSTEIRAKRFISISALLLLAFVLLRFVNVWGDTAPWSVQKDTLFTFMSFINVSKYPPSLFYILITLSVSFFMLYLTEKLEGKWKEVMMVYGSVPMFYYIIHFYLIHSISLLILLAQGFVWSDFRFGPFQFGRPEAPSGLGLGGVYVFWIGVVIFLYPLCKKYSAYKKAHPEKEWLRYL
ncbi:MAG: DUF1624 domain-containing protein [Cyclobacteriaceae bacterium]|jgi:uncharacterized membrane protein|nr:heparan-alpha-glucosaminide N-acetyltransferase domain-containing protein [Flammeovirgaceae bacterium]